MAEAAPEKLREDFRSRVNTWIQKNFYQPNEVLWNNEVQANLFVANIMLGTAALIMLVVLLSLIKPFPGESGKTRGVLVLAALLVAAPAGVCHWKKGKKKWMKLLLLAVYAVVLAQVESVLTSGVLLGLLFPIILSIRYYSRAMTQLTGLMTAVFLLIASRLAVIFHLGTVDLNLLELPGGTVLRFAEKDSLYHAVMSQAEIDTRQLWHSTLVQSYLPRLILLVLITLICAEIAKRGRVLLFEEHEEIKKTERISMELELAKSIQKNMIPNLYPAFPDRKEFDVYARMEPAKELGGRLLRLLYDRPGSPGAHHRGRVRQGHPRGHVHDGLEDHDQQPGQEPEPRPGKDPQDGQQTDDGQQRLPDVCDAVDGDPGDLHRQIGCGQRRP